MTPLKIIIPLTGLHCVSCVRMAERALAAVPGVASAHVDLASRRALVEYDPGRTAPAALEQAIEAAGYGVIRAGEGQIEDLEDRERVRETRALRARFFISAAFAVPLLLVSMAGTGSTTPPRSPRPISGSRSARGRTWRGRRAISCSCGTTRGMSPQRSRSAAS